MDSIIHLIFVLNLKTIIMNKGNLVVLRGDKALEFQTDTMYPNTYYRCLKATDGLFVFGLEEPLNSRLAG